MVCLERSAQWEKLFPKKCVVPQEGCLQVEAMPAPLGQIPANFFIWLLWCSHYPPVLITLQQAPYLSGNFLSHLTSSFLPLLLKWSLRLCSVLPPASPAWGWPWLCLRDPGSYQPLSSWNPSPDLLASLCLNNKKTLVLNRANDVSQKAGHGYYFFKQDYL